MSLVPIKPGKFMMGSPETEKGRSENEGPQHEVTLTKGFYLGAAEVTEAQYKAVTGHDKPWWMGPTYPVPGVTWQRAVEFCRRLSEKTGRRARLPTEAEWEYACRAGSQARFCFGDDDKKLGDYAWYADNSKNAEGTGVWIQPVGRKKPNAWGLYDMHGNQGEWCADWLGPYTAASVVDPRGQEIDRSRAVRGGTTAPPEFCRSAARMQTGADSSSPFTGFRVLVESQDSPSR
jgi:formylglycine-generating enzyme required for sulfatase activity